MAQDVVDAPRANSDAPVNKISKPPAGMTVVVRVQPGEVVGFDFARDSVRLVVDGVDVHLVFEDGSRIILPGLALDMATEEHPHLYFGEAVLSQPDFFALVGQVEVATEFTPDRVQTVLATNAVSPDPETPNGELGKGGATPSAGVNPDTGEGEPRTSEAVTQPLPSEPQEIAAGSGLSNNPLRIETTSVPGNDNANTSNNNNSGTGEGGELLNDVTFRLYGYLEGDPGYSEEAGSGGAPNVYESGFSGVAAKPPATSSSLPGATYQALSSPDRFKTSDQNDLVNLDSSRATDTSSQTGRIAVAPRLTIDLAGNSSGGVLEITLPTGYSLIGSDFTRNPGTNTFTRTYDKAGSSLQFDLNLAYTPPADGDAKDKNGFYGASTTGSNLSQITIVFATTSGKTTHKYTGSLDVGVKDIGQESDLTFTTSTGKKALVLPSVLGANSVDAGGGDDTIQASAAGDTIDGGTGADLVSYSTSNSGVRVRLADGDDVSVAGEGGYAKGDRLVHVEHLTGSKFADTLSGNAGANSLSGGAGDDLLSGNAGADTLSGGSGANTLDGGADNDVYLVSSNDDVIVEREGGGDHDLVRVTGATSVTLAAWVEDLVDAGTSALFARGNALANSMAGNDQAETFSGAGGNDTLDGGQGNDRLEGGGDNVKIIETGGGVDTLTIQASAGWTFNSSQNDSANRIEVINVQATNGAAMSVYGDGGDNAITLTNAGAVAGGHTLDGGTGSDTLKGSTGSDILVLDIGDLSFGVNAGKATASDSIAGGAGTDTGLLRASSATVLTATGAQLDAIFDTTEVLDFRGANVQVGQSGAVTSFTAADIQGIVGNGAASSLTIRFDAASSGASLHDFIGVMAGGGTTVTDGQGSVVTSNTALAAGTYTFRNGANIVAQLVLQAS
ncbi:MAG: calcium-binding protein [Alsobacter sp.]